MKTPHDSKTESGALSFLRRAANSDISNYAQFRKHPWLRETNLFENQPFGTD